MILLDTDVMVDVLRKQPAALMWFSTLGNDDIAVPGYVAMELMQGCRTNTEMREIQSHLRSMTILWPDTETCEQAMNTFASARLAHGIGLLDTLVGCLAASLDVCLHTFNSKHYAGLPSVRTVEPYVR